MTDLNALIERLSRATGPDGNLDIDIYKASGQARAPDSSVMEFMLDHDGDALWRVKHEGQDFGSWWHVPQFSSSIDAAMTLVDPQSHETIDRYVVSDKPNQMAYRVWIKKLVGDIDGDGPCGLQTEFATGPTIPLAITIAALSARTRTARGKSGSEKL